MFDIIFYSKLAFTILNTILHKKCFHKIIVTNQICAIQKLHIPHVFKFVRKDTIVFELHSKSRSKLQYITIEVQKL